MQRPYRLLRKSKAADRMKPACCRLLIAGAMNATPLAIFLVHISHSAARHLRHHRLVIFRNLGDHDFSREHETRYRCCVLKGGPCDLGRIDDTGLYQVRELFALSVKAVVGVLGGLYLLRDDRALEACIGHDLSERLLKRLLNDLDAELLVSSSFILSRFLMHLNSATPPPGTIPSSTAARVA